MVGEGAVNFTVDHAMIAGKLGHDIGQHFRRRAVAGIPYHFERRAAIKAILDILQ